jgi:hypothetical protein
MLDIVDRERRDAWAAVRAVTCLSPSQRIKQLAVAPSDGELNAFKFGILRNLLGRMTVPVKLT